MENEDTIVAVYFMQPAMARFRECKIKPNILSAVRGAFCADRNGLIAAAMDFVQSVKTGFRELGVLRT